MMYKALRTYIRKEVKSLLKEEKSPEDIKADKEEVEAAQAALDAAEEKVDSAKERLDGAKKRAAQRESKIKLKALLEEEGEEDTSDDDANPFADGGGEDTSDAPDEDADGEDAPDEDADGEDADDEGAEKAGTPDIDDITISFNISRVKRYNKDKSFSGSEGVVQKITKDGMLLKVMPDDVDIFVNFEDIR